MKTRAHVKINQRQEETIYWEHKINISMNEHTLLKISMWSTTQSSTWDFFFNAYKNPEKSTKNCSYASVYDSWKNLLS